MKKSVLALLLLVSGIAHSAQEPVKRWVQIADNNIAKYYLKDYSIKFSKNDAGIPIVFGIGMRVGKDKSRQVFQYYVKTAACTNEYGVVYWATTEGVYVGEADFAFKQGTVGSNIAEGLCSALDHDKRPPHKPPV
jgi:hypothetical protein